MKASSVTSSSIMMQEGSILAKLKSVARFFVRVEFRIGRALSIILVFHELFKQLLDLKIFIGTLGQLFEYELEC